MYMLVPTLTVGRSGGHQLPTRSSRCYLAPIALRRTRIACSTALVTAGGLAQRVEHHEVVDGALVVDARGPHPASVSLRHTPRPHPALRRPRRQSGTSLAAWRAPPGRPAAVRRSRRRAGCGPPASRPRTRPAFLFASGDSPVCLRRSTRFNP